MQKLRKVIFEEHLFGSAWWATLYPEADLIKKNFVAQSDLGDQEDRQMMANAFDEKKGRHELTLFNNKRQGIAASFREHLLAAVKCPPLPTDPPPMIEDIAARKAKLEKAKEGEMSSLNRARLSFAADSTLTSSLF